MSTETIATAPAARAYLVEFTWHLGYQGTRFPVAFRVRATSEAEAEVAGRARVHNEVSACRTQAVTVTFVGAELV